MLIEYFIAVYLKNIWLEDTPRGFSDQQLKRGVVIEIPSLAGQPVIGSNGMVQDPLTADAYDARIVGETAHHFEIRIKRKYMFDSFIINIGC